VGVEGHTEPVEGDIVEGTEELVVVVAVGIVVVVEVAVEIVVVVVEVVGEIVVVVGMGLELVGKPDEVERLQKGFVGQSFCFWLVFW